VQSNAVEMVTAALNGCETWFLVLNEVHRLNVSEKRMLKEIYDTKKDKTIGERDKYTINSFIT
jgi:hypothetical protein